MKINCHYLLKFMHISVLLSCLISFSQIPRPKLQEITMTPNVGSLFKYKSTNVNESTGVANVNIPIYNIVVDDLELKINMNYDSNGVKVEEECSSVGNSWSLFNTGVINRIQNGLADEHTQTLAYPGGLLEGTNLSCTSAKIVPNVGWFQQAQTSNNLAVQLEQNSDLTGYNGNEFSSYLFYVWDQKQSKNDIIEPDRFMYVLPNGKKGSFIIKQNNLIVNSSADKISIYFDSANNISSFRITDELGNVYHFDVVENFRRPGFFDSFPIGSKQIASFPSPSLTDLIVDFPPLNWGGNCPQYDTASPNYSSPGFMDIYNRKINISWFLSKIVTPKNKQIDFTYVDENYIKLTSLNSKAVYNSNSDWPRMISNDLLSYTTKRLIKIQWPEGEMQFNYNPAVREDVKKSSWLYPNISTDLRALKDIKIYDINNQEKINVVFNTSYRLSNGINSVSNEYKYLYKRLWLDGIVFNNNQVYQFQYNLNNLPSKVSYEQDFWGNYNGNQSDTNGKSNVPDLWYYPTDPKSYSRPTNLSIFRRSNFVGLEKRVSTIAIDNTNTTFGNFVSNRDIDETKMKHGILESIIYPTKGYENFEYESNDFLYEGELKKGFGLRIKKIDVYDNNNLLSSSTDYTYKKEDGTSSGSITNLPIFGRGERRYDSDNNLIVGFTISSSSLADENNLYYSRVQKKLLNNGKSISEYIIPYTIETETALPFNGSFLYKKNYNNSSSNIPCDQYYGPFCNIQNTFDYNPLANNINLQNLFGLKSKEYIYDESNILKRLAEFDYVLREDSKRFSYLLGQSPNKIWTINAGTGTGAFQQDFPYYAMRRHRIKSFVFSDFLLSRKKITEYLSTGNLISENFYAYNSKGLLLENKYTNSKGEIISTKFDYCDSNLLEFNFNYSDMKTLNMLNYPVIVSKFKDNKLIYKNFNRYDSNSIDAPFVPIKPAILVEEFELETNEPIIVFNEFNWYDVTQPNFGQMDSRMISKKKYHNYDKTNGNLREFSNLDGMHTVFLWGYNKTKVIAKIENITFTSIPSSTITNLEILSNNDTDNCTSVTCKEQILRNALNELRNAFPNSMVTTYTYDNLIGITSITYVKGDVLYYNYDNMGRLNQVKDKDGNILSKNEYNFKQ